jgi:hypothetical protein
MERRVELELLEDLPSRRVRRVFAHVHMSTGWEPTLRVSMVDEQNP